MKNSLKLLPFIALALLFNSCAEPAQNKVSEDKSTIEQVAETTIMQEDKRVRVKISTKFGDMVAELYNETPKHRDNFVKLINEGFYNDLLFHRVMSEFMIQGGDPESRGAEPGKRLGSGGPGYTIPAEILPQFFHKKGALAAARQPDNVNPEKNSSGSQFYIVQGLKIPATMNPQKENQMIQEYLLSPEGEAFNNEMNELRNQARTNPSTAENARVRFQEIVEEVRQIVKANYEKNGPSEKDKIYEEIGGYPSLDGGYTVFGEVIEGLEVIDLIAAVETASPNRPVEDVSMTLSIVD